MKVGIMVEVTQTLFHRWVERCLMHLYKTKWWMGERGFAATEKR